MTIVIYRQTSGEIFQIMQGGTLESAALCCQFIPGLDCAATVEEVTQTDWYVRDGEAVPRPVNPATLDGLVLSDVPEGSTLYLDDEEQATVAGTVTLGFPFPGEYTLRLECFPYLPATFKVRV